MSISSGSPLVTTAVDDNASCASTVVDEDDIMAGLAHDADEYKIDQPDSDADREKREQWAMFDADQESSLMHKIYQRLAREYYDKSVEYATLHNLDRRTATRMWQNGHIDLRNKCWTNTFEEHTFYSQTHLPCPWDVLRWDAINAAHEKEDATKNPTKKRRLA